MFSHYGDDIYDPIEEKMIVEPQLPQTANVISPPLTSTITVPC